MRIALYGGSFDPPHLAHQLACTVALSAGSPPVDELLMIPTFEHAFGKPLAPYAHRLAMCELAARPFGGRVIVSRIEEELGGASYTLRTVEALRARRPEDELVLVIGADLLAERPRWHRWPELERLVSFLVIGRAGAADGALGPRDHRVPIELPDVSSTTVRRRIAEGGSTVGLVDERVAAYLRRAGLYR